MTDTKSAAMFARIVFSLFACLTVLPTLAIAEEFLVVSDIHFKPFADLNEKQFRVLQDLPAEHWPEFLLKRNDTPSRPGSDSNFALMSSSLDAAKKRVPDPAFILYPGDFLAHHWQEDYDQLADESIAENPKAYREFTMTAIEVIAIEFKKRFPKTPVIATLGNDDSFCGDYWIQPNGDFLTRFAKTWHPMLDDSLSQEAFEKTFNKLGVYQVDIPKLSADRVIVLNTVLWSGSYCTNYFSPKKSNCCECTNGGTKPGHQQLDWLEAELKRARKQNRRVWLLMHVPPGLDSYAEEKANGHSLAAEMWKQEFMTRYLQLIEEYEDILHASFTGHTHMDDYRIDQINDRPVLLHKIAPAVSPIFGNNPAFQVFQVNQQSSVIENWETFYLPLSSVKSQPKWQREYDGQATYQVNALTATEMTKFFRDMRENPSSLQASAFRKLYSVSANSIASKDLPIYLCTVLNATYAQFAKCLAEHQLAKPTQAKEPVEVRLRAESHSQKAAQQN